jgi:hypothetical protein
MGLLSLKLTLRVARCRHRRLIGCKPNREVVFDTFLSVVVLLSLADASLLIAQDEAPTRSQLSTNARQTVSVSTFGLNRYLPGYWGTLSVEAINRATEAGTLESVAWVEGRVDEQFGRSVWVPAESRRVTWKPVFVPPRKFGAKDPILYWMQVRNSGGNEVLATAANRDRIESRTLIKARSETVFAVIHDDDERQIANYDLLTYMLGQTQSQGVTISIDVGQMPVIAEALDAVSILVVMGDSLAGEAAAIEAVHDWVRQGGTLWLMLDTMTADSAQAITGGDLPIHEVDRVSLNSYTLVSTVNASRREPDNVDLERPVQLVRILSEDAIVMGTADGWPIAVSNSFGRGRVVASMLSLDGWYVPRGNLEPEHAATLDRQLWITTAGHDLNSSLDGKRIEPPVDSDTMTEYVTARVGYQLPGRSRGAIVLILYCTVLTLVCVAVHQRRRPVILMPGITILSLLAVGVFLAMATSSRTVSDSAVTFQLVEASGMQDQLHVSGVTAFHSRESVRPDIRSTAAGRLRFDGPVTAGSPVRMLWSDQNVWQLKDAKLAPGVRLAEFRESVELQQPVVVKGTFVESGFQGTLDGEVSSEFSDALLADQTGFVLPVEIDSAGDVSASAAGPLPPGQYLAAAILNAEQARRQKVYRRMFDPAERSRIYPERPTLFAWSAPLKLQTGRADVESPAGAMLMSVPLIIERPEAGTRVRIPSTFLPYRAVRIAKSRIGFASTYSNSRRTWSANTSRNASTSVLRFEIPSAVLPLVVDKATLTLKVSAPLRTVEISSGLTDALTDVWTKSSPVGTFEIPLKVEASRKLDPTGGLNVAFKVGSVQLEELDAAEVGTQDRSWQVDWMQLEIQGLIQ